MLNFLGIGAQKAGTTWLYSQLARHPKVRFPAGKEVHYWDWIEAGKRPARIEWYANLFRAGDGLVQGEITPDYAVLSESHVSEIHELNPDLRILFILRNPIERAWSAAQMGLDRLLMTRDEATDQWFIDVFRSRSSLGRGDYEATLRRWRKYFRRDQILVLYYEDLQDRPRQLLAKVSAHLGLDGTFFDAVPHAELTRKVHPGAGWHVAKRYPLSPRLAAELRRLYAGKIRSLGHYLGRDLSRWLEPGDETAVSTNV